MSKLSRTGQFTGLISEFKKGSGKTLFQNFLSLSLLQMTNYLLPLIILPYLIRTVGIEKFGLIAFAQAVMQYFVILTDYGFHLYATREISANRTDSKRVSEIFCSVFIIRFLLSGVAFGILYLLLSFTGKFSEDPKLYLYTFGIVIGSLLFPVWLFQGMEKMKHSTIIQLIGKLFYLATLFIIVESEADYLIVPLLNSVGLILSGLVAMTVILTMYKVRVVVPSVSTIVGYFRDSSQFFMSKVSVSLYTSINTVVLGLFMSNEIVGLYSAAEKLFIAMRSAFAPIAQALYPYMADKRNLNLFKKIYQITLAFAIILAASVYFFSSDIVRIAFGPDMELSARILRVFALTVPLAANSILLGFPLLAAVGYEKSANVPAVIASVLHMAMLAAIIPVIDPIKVVTITLITEVAVVSMFVHQIRKYNLWHSVPVVSK